MGLWLGHHGAQVLRSLDFAVVVVGGDLVWAGECRNQGEMQAQYSRVECVERARGSWVIGRCAMMCDDDGGNDKGCGGGGGRY